MKNRLYIAIFLLFVLPAVLSAQTAARIERLLETEAVTYGQVAQFLLEAAGVLGYTAAAEAFRYAEERQWLPGDASPSAEARLDGVALLIMRSFDIRGGIMYSLFRNARYAYRELVYLDVIHGRISPSMAVSGDLLLFMVGRILSLSEEGQL